jgi:hypothetical protein
MRFCFVNVPEGMTGQIESMLLGWARGRGCPIEMPVETAELDNFGSDRVSEFDFVIVGQRLLPAESARDDVKQEREAIKELTSTGGKVVVARSRMFPCDTLPDNTKFLLEWPAEWGQISDLMSKLEELQSK